MEALKMLISSMELGSQEEVLRALEKEGFKLTQATLSRDLKQLKVAKAASFCHGNAAVEWFCQHQLLRQYGRYQDPSRLCQFDCL